jgi:hypothetical protein
MVVINLNSVGELNKWIIKLTPEISKEILKKSDDWMNFVQKSAKIRAPRNTGELANSIIKSRKGNTITISVMSPYGIFVNSGFRSHFVNSNTSTRNSLGTIGNAYGIPPGIPIFIKGHSGSHFIEKAVESAIGNLPKMIENGIINGVKNAR